MAATTSLGIVRTPESPGTSAPTLGPTLQQFAEAASMSDGLSVSALAPIAQLEVRTRNTIYRITTFGGGDGRILIEGGRFFPVQSEVRLNGGTLGGSLLKVGWIGCGFCMELVHEGQRITTTRVREIRRIEPLAASVH
jgi:hypothetical protein